MLANGYLTVKERRSTTTEGIPANLERRARLKEQAVGIVLTLKAE